MQNGKNEKYPSEDCCCWDGWYISVKSEIDALIAGSGRHGGRLRNGYGVKIEN
jgi:hypothetical protein